MCIYSLGRLLHSNLIPYALLSPEDKLKDMRLIVIGLQSLCSMGYCIRHRKGVSASVRVMDDIEIWRSRVKSDYTLHCIPLKTSMSKKKYNLACQLAERASLLWDPVAESEMAGHDARLTENARLMNSNPAVNFAAMSEERRVLNLHRAVVLLEMISGLGFELRYRSSRFVSALGDAIH